MTMVKINNDDFRITADVRAEEHALVMLDGLLSELGGPSGTHAGTALMAILTETSRVLVEDRGTDRGLVIQLVLRSLGYDMDDGDEDPVMAALDALLR